MATKTQTIQFELKAIDKASSVMQKVGGDLSRLQKFGGQGVQAFDLAPLRKAFSFDEKTIRADVAKGISIAREELAAKNREFSLTGFDANKEARERFLATGTAAREAGLKASEGMESFTDKAIKAGLILQGMKASTHLVAAGVDLMKAKQAEANKEFSVAAQKYLGFAETVRKVPIVGGFAFDAADYITGGAGTAAEKALADSANIDARTKSMAEERSRAKGAVADIINQNKLDMLPDEQRGKAVEDDRHRRELDAITEQVKTRKLGEEDAAKWRASEAARHTATLKQLDEEREENRRRMWKEFEIEEMKSEGNKQAAERAEFEEGLKRREVEAAKLGPDALGREKLLNTRRLETFNKEQASKAAEILREEGEKKSNAAREQQARELEDKIGASKKKAEEIEALASQRTTAVQLAGADQNRFLTGLAEAAKANNPVPAIVKAAQDELKELKRNTEVLQKLYDYVRKGGGPVIIPVSTTI